MNEYRVKTMSRTAQPRSRRRRAESASAAVASGNSGTSGNVPGNDWFELRMVEGTDDSPRYYLITRYGIVSEQFITSGGNAPASLLADYRERIEALESEVEELKQRLNGVQ